MLSTQKGRPVDLSERLDKEIRVYDLLDRLEIEYLRVDHEPLATMEACQEVDEILDINMCKNLFLCNAQKTKFYLLLMPGDKKFKTKDLSHQIGSARLSFAVAEDMERLLDITPGSASVMGLMNDTDNLVQLLIDGDLLQNDYLACHPCINTSSIKLTMEELLHKFLPEVYHLPIIVTL
jgi:Ala-tRNA(Pro) deacylase